MTHDTELTLSKNAKTSMTAGTTEAMLDPRLVRVILRASQNLLMPRHFEQFLKRAGLEHFKEQLSETTKTPRVPTHTLALFMQMVATKLGSDTVQLFYTNVGREILQELRSNDLILKFKAHLETLPLIERGAAALQDFVDWLRYMGGDLTLLTTPEAQVWQVVVHNCPYCQGIEADQPLCNVTTILLSEVPKILTGWSFVSTELTCVAQNAPNCVYEVREQLF
jgi:predicted hydrocarbon binding protein